MKGSILLTAIAIAMATSAQAQQPVPCLKLSNATIANHALRQQQDTEAKLIFKARNCAVAQLRDGTIATFESKGGLDVVVSSVGFGHPNEERAGTLVAKARELSVSLKLSVSPDLPVGGHTLHGLLTYQVIDGSGNLAPETLAIDVPFQVAPHKPYKKVALPDDGRPRQESSFVHGLKIAGMIAAGIPLFILMLIWCPISGNCPAC